MPEDIEILWVEALVYVLPVSERGMEWLQGVLPQRYKWDMRTVSHGDLEGFTLAARKQHVTIGGVHLPPEEIE